MLTPDNADFRFFYAVVFEDPEHLPEEQPFFQYRIFYIDNMGIEQEIELFKVLADVDDPFFDNDGGDIAYRNWTCVNVDLSSYVDQNLEIIVEFINADCEQGGHFGYSYIDGLCQDAEDSLPTPLFDVNDTECTGTLPIFIDASDTYNENQWDWRVCQLTGSGQETNCVETSGFNNAVNIDNLEQYYIDGGEDFDCDKEYRITLTVNNDCNDEQSLSKDVFIACGKIVDYPNIAYCEEFYSLPFPIVGVNEITNGTYSWSTLSNPAFIDNPSVAFPNVTDFEPGQSNFSLSNITIDNETGCIYEDDVTVRKLGEVHLNVEVTAELCSRRIDAFVQTSLGMDNISVLLTNLDTDEVTVLSNLSLHETLPYYGASVYLASWESSNENANNFEVSVVLGNLPDGDNFEYSEGCIESEIINFEAFPFHGDFAALAFSNVITANNDGLNDFWGVKSIGTAGNTKAYNATSFRIKVWSRWGENDATVERTIFELADPNTGFFQDDIQWDGKDNEGNQLPNGVYVVFLQIGNCAHPIPGDDCDSDYIDETEPYTYIHPDDGIEYTAQVHVLPGTKRCFHRYVTIFN
jgi:hypothetical protein